MPVVALASAEASPPPLPIGPEAPGTWPGLNASVTMPLPLSQLAMVTPCGSVNSRLGRFRSATAM